DLDDGVSDHSADCLDQDS
nr:Chain E, peptide from E3 ubiquitin-protein ligase Mdm2 [Rattus norvegicus]8HSV_F Chain F, peptide from E3 ubiquitin-protein ligase Mdm2 [Rattus norvegicus]